MLNVAVTSCAAFIVTVQLPVPLHPPPLHPANVDPLFAVALRFTCVPPEYDALHCEGHAIPEGVLVTLPVPFPAVVTVNVYVVSVNVAVTDCAAFIVIVHTPVPLHAALPLHPANVLPVVGVAVSTTCVPLT